MKSLSMAAKGKSKRLYFMGHGHLKNNYAFVLLPAFTVGIKDGINPCGLASALILILYLSWIGYTQKRVFTFGLLFIMASIVTQFGLVQGVFDVFLTAPTSISLFRILYFLMALGFILLGAINIFDRLQYGKFFNTKLFKCKVPAFLRIHEAERTAHKRGNVFRVIGVMLLAVVIGAIVTLFASLYPQLEYIFIIHSYYMAGGDMNFALSSFAQYCVATVLPQIFALIVVLIVGLMREKRKAILYYKSISAALFLSVGIGLLFFLLR
ncbi:MAG: hypothetical protein JW847_02510 [Candidatus Omnitrophica bacterium]|nr:hypothetical protein [Candidatus Omnitrophota bacterium]